MESMFRLFRPRSYRIRLVVSSPHISSSSSFSSSSFPCALLPVPHKRSPRTRNTPNTSDQNEDPHSAHHRLRRHRCIRRTGLARLYPRHRQRWYASRTSVRWPILTCVEQHTALRTASAALRRPATTTNANVRYSHRQLDREGSFLLTLARHVRRWRRLVR